MAPTTRRTILLLFLGAAAALLALEEPPGGDGTGGMAAAAPRKAVPETLSAPPGTHAAGQGEETAMIQEIRPRPPAPGVAKAFTARDWTPATSPPPPTAPPLPFVFLGKKLEDGHWQVFLGQDDRTYIVRENEAIDGLYRVEAIRLPAMTLTYLPLRQRQTLDIGDAR